MADADERATDAARDDTGQERMYTQAETEALIAERLAEERARYPGEAELAAFRAWQQTGRVRFTTKLAQPGDGSMTREQIMAIPDRKRRRSAIAENINLFEKEK